jgi:hypothetical protein
MSQTKTFSSSHMFLCYLTIFFKINFFIKLHCFRECSKEHEHNVNLYSNANIY